jgi:hypothetical protein
VGCAVGGANPAPPAHQLPPGVGEGWSATNGERRQRRRTAPSLPARRLAVTLSNENARSRFRAYSRPATAGLRAVAATLGPAGASLAKQYVAVGTPRQRP